MTYKVAVRKHGSAEVGDYWVWVLDTLDYDLATEYMEMQEASIMVSGGGEIRTRGIEYQSPKWQEVWGELEAKARQMWGPFFMNEL